MTRTPPLALRVAALVAVFGVAGCQTLGPYGGEVSRQYQEAPPGASPGSCWGKHATPAIIETVTEQILLQPAEVTTDGRVLHPAIYKNETRQQIMRERRETWFETPCEREATPEFIASVQRALAARGLYNGPITGEMDSRTRAAVRAYQAPEGLDSRILSLAASRKLGLSAIPRGGN